MLHVGGQEVFMTPFGSVKWQSSELDAGTLYLPGKDAQLDHETAALLQSGAKGEQIGAGNSGGQVYLPPDGVKQDVVIKEFTARLSPHGMDFAEQGGLFTLRANVALAAGLEMLDQSNATWRFQCAAILGALILPHKVNPKRTLHARWIIQRAKQQEGVDTAPHMTYYERKEHPNAEARLVKATARPKMPSYAERTFVYGAAFTAVGLDKAMLRADDHPDNTFIERLPVKRFFKTVAQGIATKIDVTPKPLSGFHKAYRR